MILLGLVSFALTIINIICIIVTGFGILRLKEVTPDKIPQWRRKFWKNDIMVHRRYMKSIKAPNDQHQQRKDSIPMTEVDQRAFYYGESDGLEGPFLKTMFEKAMQDEVKQRMRFEVKQILEDPVLNRTKRSKHM